MDDVRVPLQSLTIGAAAATVRVRVARLWNSINLRSNDVFGLNMQLLDNEGGEMHAMIGPRFLQLFQGQLQEGLVYDIAEFNVTHAGDRYLPIHKSMKIDFNAMTSVTKIDSHSDRIPMHKFSFADYATIITRTDSIKYLTDVIGILHNVGEVVNQQTINGSVAAKRELVIYLHCGTRLAATLWGDKVSIIDRSALDDNNNTVILTSMTVRNYQGKPSLASTSATCIYTNLDIAEGSNLLKTFRKRKLPLVSSEGSNFKKVDDMVIGKTLSDIISPDLDIQYEGKIFEFEGKITNVVLDNGWEYFSCNICKSRVDGSAPTTRCNKCGREIAFPLHRFRLEVIVEDGTATASIVLFDKVAEFLTKQKAESLYRLQTSEVGGSNKVASILNQVVGRTEIFQAKRDTFVTSASLKKLIATRINTPATDVSTGTVEQSFSKVPSTSDVKAAPVKGPAKKKLRTLAN